MKKLLVLYLLFQPIFCFGNSNALQEFKQSSMIAVSLLTAGLGYELLKDQVTSRISSEYFAKKFDLKSNAENKLKTNLSKIFSPNSLKVLLPVAAFTVASRIGSWPKLGISDLFVPTGLLIGGMGLASSISGVATFDNANKINPDDKEFKNPKHPAFRLSKENLANFYVGKNIDFASNAVGVVGSMALIGWIVDTRYQLKLIQDQGLISQIRNIISDIKTDDLKAALGYIGYVYNLVIR